MTQDVFLNIYVGLWTSVLQKKNIKEISNNYSANDFNSMVNRFNLGADNCIYVIIIQFDLKHNIWMSKS